jgi:RNA polymerase sigma-70 factor (ECF subfamily)
MNQHPSIAAHDDHDLARRCLRGDPTALREFTHRFRPVATAAVATVGFTGVDADEIVQRLFIRLLVPTDARAPKLATYEGAGALQGWVRISAVREALMVRRAERATRERSAELDVVEDPTPHPESSAAQVDAEYHLRGAFGRVVEQLDARERNLLRYAAYAGANQEQVAQTYGVHRATVSRWFDRLRTKLRKRTLGELALEAKGRDRATPAELLPSRLDMHMSQVLGRALEPERA